MTRYEGPPLQVGTTTWLAHFLSLADLPQDEVEDVHLHQDVPKLFPVHRGDPSIGILAQATISFSMVRHPFERIVSAYEDKIVKGKDRWYGWVKQRLIKEYGNTSFSAFVKMLLIDGRKVNLLSPRHT